jgi:hypothetical protein
MKSRLVTFTLVAAVLVVFGMGVSARRLPGDKTQGDSTTQGQSNSGMMSGGMMGRGAGQGQGMMGGGMTGMMGQMTAHHEQMSALMNKLMQSMAAIQSEKNPQALKSKLADHQALLDQMRSQMMQQGNMMQMMSGQMKQSCPGASETTKPPTE